MGNFINSDEIYIYDIETLPNFFSCVVRHRRSRVRWIFEVSDRYNHAPDFCEFMHTLGANGAMFVGFNNFYFDWQVCQHLLNIGPRFTALEAYDKADSIIKSSKDEKFKNVIWGSEHTVKQLDLYLMHHFDNHAKSTSLKEIEFNMRSDNIGDLPFVPGEIIPREKFDKIIEYNCHDVDETEKFAVYSAPMIDFRSDLISTLGHDVFNYNDTKIGKKFFEKELKKSLPRLKKGGTPRTSIHLKDVIFDSISFESPEFTELLDKLKCTTLTRTKEPPELKDLSVMYKGFEFHVGAGGAHGSIESKHVQACENVRIVDVDVASFYPSLAIVNKFYPAHLSEAFCHIYEDVYNKRLATKKKTAPNEMLKLALNGVYGDSNNEFSIFFDPQYTMQTTINGQLLLYMLSESILKYTQSEMIQVNTDGITFTVTNCDYDKAVEICKKWENQTKLKLEFNEYSDMWIKNVNSYMAKEKFTGNVKRIKDYANLTQRENPATREIKWHSNHSALVVPKAACAFMTDGIPVREFVENHADKYDFLLREKSTGKVKLELVKPDGTCEVQPKVTRYYMALEGGELRKVHPPLDSSPDKDRFISVNKDYKVATCNDIRDFNQSNINLEWYITQARKLIIGVNHDNNLLE
jgi:hypothetical protein